MMTPAKSRGNVDFGIITIREDEFEAVLERFPEDLGIVSGRRQYNLRRMAPDDPYTVAIVRCASQANGEAQQVANALLDELAPRWLLVVGIAGGAPATEFTLGDVVVATEVCDFNVGAVLTDGSHEYALHGWMSHPDVAKLVANLPAMRRRLGAWNSSDSIRFARPRIAVSPKSIYGDTSWQRKVRKALRHHVSSMRQEPRVTAGAIACSDLVMKNAELLQVWLKITRHAIAVEMESAGVHKAAHERHVPFLSVRGLSDIVGLSRDPRWTTYACHSAAAFTRAFLLTRPVPVPARPALTDSQATSERSSMDDGVGQRSDPESSKYTSDISGDKPKTAGNANELSTNDDAPRPKADAKAEQPPELKYVGSSDQLRVLWFLVQNDSSAQLTWIADRLRVPYFRAQREVSKLEEAGLITTSPQDPKGEEIRCRLTSSGVELVCQLGFSKEPIQRPSRRRPPSELSVHLPPHTSGVVHDVSEDGSGMGIIVDEPLDVGVEISIQFEATDRWRAFKAKVIHLRSTSYGTYFVGLSIRNPQAQERLRTRIGDLVTWTKLSDPPPRE